MGCMRLLADLMQACLSVKSLFPAWSFWTSTVYACLRRGRYLLTRLVERNGAGMKLLDLRDMLARIIRSGRFYSTVDILCRPRSRNRGSVKLTSWAGSKAVQLQRLL